MATSSPNCIHCGRPGTLRRGMCPACYQRWRRGTVPAEARCAACGCLDGRVLRSLRLSSGETVTTCYNCSQLAGRAIPRPASVAALRALAEVPGERRRGLDRRADDRRTSPPVSFGEWDRRSATRRALDRVATR